MNKTGKRWSKPENGLEMSALRSQLIAKLGVEPTASDSRPDESATDDPLGPESHLKSEWIKELLVATRAAGIELRARPSLGASRQAHDVLTKRLKANGKKREKAALDDLRSRYLKKREKVAWTRLKNQIEDKGLSVKFYRSLKQSGVEPERLIERWARASKKNLNQAELRGFLLGQ